MLFFRYEDKEIPVEGAWQNPDFVAYMERIEEQRLKAEERRWARTSARATALGVFIAICAAGAALWSGYEAHRTRIQDERPYMRAQFAGVSKETFFPTHAKESQQIFTPHLKLTEFGRTPSTDIRVYMICSTGKPFDLDMHLTEVVQQMFPSDILSEYCHDDPHIIMDKDKAIGIVYLRGVVFYEDMDRRKYQTPFCYEWSVGTDNSQESVTNCFSDTPLK